MKPIIVSCKKEPAIDIVKESVQQPIFIGAVTIGNKKYFYINIDRYEDATKEMPREISEIRKSGEVIFIEHIKIVVCNQKTHNCTASCGIPNPSIGSYACHLKRYYIECPYKISTNCMVIGGKDIRTHIHSIQRKGTSVITFSKELEEYY